MSLKRPSVMNAKLAGNFLNLIKTAEKRKSLLNNEMIYDKLHEAIHSESLQVD